MNVEWLPTIELKSTYSIHQLSPTKGSVKHLEKIY